MNAVALWPDLVSGLRELHRVTRPGGLVLIAWHGGKRRSMAARRLVLPEDKLDHICEGLGTLFTAVTRHELDDLTVFTATRSGL